MSRKPITIFYDFTYRHVGVSDLKIDPLLLPQLAQSVRVGIAEINLIQDRRDDPLDAHKGIYNTLDVGLATKIFGSQTSFARILGRNATYYPLGRKLVLARETQFGLQPAFCYSGELGAGRSDSAGRAFFRRRWKYAARISGKPGRAARYFDRVSAGRLGAVLQQHRTALSALRRQYQRRARSKTPGILFQSRQHFVSGGSAESGGFRLHGSRGGFRHPLPDADRAVAARSGLQHQSAEVTTVSRATTRSWCSARRRTPARLLLQQISHFQFFFSIGQAF